MQRAWSRSGSCLASLAAACLFGAAQANAQSDKPRVVRIGVLGILAEVGLYVAVEQGFFAKEGLSVEFRKDMTGADGFPALATGQIDAMGGAFGPELINAVARGINTRVVAGLSSYIHGWDSGFLTVRRELVDSGRVKDWKDLKGLKVALAVSQNNITGYFASRYLALGGLTVKDVQVVNVPFANMIAALKTGGVDIAHTSEPLSTVIADSGIAVKWRPVTSYAPAGLTIAALHFGSSILEKDPALGERIVTAYMRGARYYLDALKKPAGKSEIAEILIKHTPVKSRPLYDQIALSYSDPDGAVSLEGMQDMANYFAGTSGAKPPDVRSLVDDRFRQAALKRLGPYQK